MIKSYIGQILPYPSRLVREPLAFLNHGGSTEPHDTMYVCPHNPY